MVALKLLLIAVSLLLLAYPLLPLSKKLKKISTFQALRYEGKDSKKNFVFVLLVLFEFLVLAFLFGLLNGLGAKIADLSFMQSLFAKISSQVKFDVHVVVSVVIVNLLVLYAFVIVKALAKKLIFNPFFGIGKKDEEKEEDKKDKGDKDESEDEDEEVLQLDHEDDGEEDEEAEDPEAEKKKAEEEEKNKFRKNSAKNRFLSIFFEGEELECARPWVHRISCILQSFIFLTEILYGFVILALLIGVFFPGPEWLYKVLHFLTAKMYIYPFISLLFLQEICNTIKAPLLTEEAAKDEEEKKTEEEEEEDKRLERLEKLKKRIWKHYAVQHNIRFFPAKIKKSEDEYKVTSKANQVALNFIKNEMQRSSGRVVQRYIEGLDALFNDRNIYFGASFYSDLGEYLIAYTYVRLLAGERQLFIVSEKDRVEYLKQYISTRLTELTGCSEQNSWRVLSYDEDHRVEKADVLVACPDDFRDDNIVDANAAFFEECCNAIFINADKVFAYDSYLCPIISSRLQIATEGRIRFVFLARDILQGFSAGLKRYFCIDEVVDYSNFEENESVDCFLWNRESLNSRTYTREERLTSIEGKIAEDAVKAGMDGVRIFTEEPIDLGEKKALLDRQVEINDFYKTTPDVNYLICTDDRHNLSSAIHSFTRFRGKKASVLHLISKPYLLREFFLSHIDRYVNRSSFIHPWATESISAKKLSLIRVFCNATAGEGMNRKEFLARMEDLVKTEGERTVLPVCPFCRKLEEKYKAEGGLSVDDYAAYLIAGLCDKVDTPEAKSVGNRARDYYIFVLPEDDEHMFSFAKEPLIRFTRISEVFDLLLTDTRRVEIRLNDRTLAYLDTVPSRVYQQYLPGQTLVYDHMEYEIERISDDRQVIYLRQENVADNHMLETIPLRRYAIENVTSGGSDGKVTFTAGPMESITLSRHFGKLTGVTFGYHTLESDSQYLDFTGKLRGQLDVEEAVIKRQTRSFEQGRFMTLTIKARQDSKHPENPCNDKMRMLFAAIFNEFIRTLFPDAYRCIAVCPVLEEPLAYRNGGDIKDFTALVKTVYPFLTASYNENGEEVGEMLKTAPDEVRLVFINDCIDDVGVLDHLFDYRAAFMQQFLTNIYAYLCWLKNNKKLPSGKHYIYFGGKNLPDVYDLDSCIALLKGCNRIFSDGKDDLTVADEDGNIAKEQEKRCAFCHDKLEVGRYFAFAPGRYICMSCQADRVKTDGELSAVMDDLQKYLKAHYPRVNFPEGVNVKLDGIYDRGEDKLLTEYAYRVDADTKTVYVEKGIPRVNAASALLHGYITLWQIENGLEIPYSTAQIYYEELLYLTHLKKNTMVKWLEDSIGSELLVKTVDIEKYITDNDLGEYAPDGPVKDTPEEGGDKPEEGTDPADDPAENSAEPDNADGDGEGDGAEDEDEVVIRIRPHEVEGRNSFTFLALIIKLRKKTPGEEPEKPDEEEEVSEEGEYTLYDPAKIPRFWKRYLMGKKATGSEDEITPDAVDTDEDGENTADDGTGEGTEEGKKKGGKKKAKEPKRKTKSGLPYLEPQPEESNIKIAVYNDIVRMAMDFSNDAIDLRGMDPQEFFRIQNLVTYDYPELFWLASSRTIGNKGYLIYRCADGKNVVDVKRVQRMMGELKHASKEFIRGISRKTDPYKALLTIYRRLLLKLVYDKDYVRKDKACFVDYKIDDPLRSLHSALVNHLVVCAGYAVALQYLLQMIGLPSGYVSSERRGNGGHAVVAVKIGKESYYLDPTWDDPAAMGEENDHVSFRYCCVPYREFIITNPPEDSIYHMPNKATYLGLEEFKATQYEYHRYHGLYLTKYSEEQLVASLTKYFKAYDPKEMGPRLHVSLKFPDVETANYVRQRLLQGGMHSIMQKVTPNLNKKQLKYFQGTPGIGYADPIYPGLDLYFS